MCICIYMCMRDVHDVCNAYIVCVMYLLCVICVVCIHVYNCVCAMFGMGNCAYVVL